MIGDDGFVVGGDAFAAAMAHDDGFDRRSQRLRQERENVAGEIEKTL